MNQANMAGPGPGGQLPAGLMEQLSKMSGVDTSGGNFMSQANQIWGMLDNMSKNDPKAYDKMIQENLKYGQDEMQKKKKKEQQKFMRVFDEKKHWVTRMVMRINRTSQKVGKADENDEFGIKQKFKMDFTNDPENKGNGSKQAVDLTKWAKEGRIYLNIFQHEA